MRACKRKSWFVHITWKFGKQIFRPKEKKIENYRLGFDPGQFKISVRLPKSKPVQLIQEREVSGIRDKLCMCSPFLAGQTRNRSNLFRIDLLHVTEKIRMFWWKSVCRYQRLRWLNWKESVRGELPVKLWMGFLLEAADMVRCFDFWGPHYKFNMV